MSLAAVRKDATGSVTTGLLLAGSTQDRHGAPAMKSR
jgi:hypothetical protein